MNLAEMRPKGFLSRINRMWQEKNEKIAKKHGWQNVPRCPACSSTRAHKEFTKYGVDIICCDDCTLRYSSKRPVNPEDIYSDGIYLPAMIENCMKNADYRKKRFGRERMALIRQHICPDGSKELLDVGCGVGWFLEVAKEEGFKVFGQELGKELAQWTGQRLGAKVFTKPLTEIAQEQQFDVITMFDLLEHVPDPYDFLLGAKKCLKPRGILLIFTPNFDSLAIQIEKEHSNLIIPAEHLTYFTKKAVEQLAKRIDLDLSYFATCGIDLGDLKSFFEWKEDPALASACERLYNDVQPVVDACGAGNHMRFILRKS